MSISRPAEVVDETTGRFLLGLVLAAATLLIFWPVVGHEFLDWDDNRYITANSVVRRGLTWDGFRWAWSTTHAEFWHPLTWLSVMTDVQLFGLDPAGHHLMGVLLHAASAWLLYAVLEGMTGSRWLSLLAAALFAWHPQRIESVAWAGERKDVLSVFFWMLTLRCYLAYVRAPGAGRYALVAGGHLLGLLSKPTIITLPVTLLCLDFWPLGRLNGSRKAVLPCLREKLPLFAMSVTDALVTVWIRRRDLGPRDSPLEIIPFSDVWIRYVEMLRKSLWWPDIAPVGDMVFRGACAWEALASLAALAGLSVWFYRARRTRPYLLAGWVWYLATWAPLIGFFKTGNVPGCDRYSYIPHIGLLLAAVWGVWSLTRRSRLASYAAFAAGVAFLAACVIGLRQHLPYWRSTEVVWARSLEVAPEQWKLQNALGVRLARRGEMELGRRRIMRALWWQPDYAEAVNNLGVLAGGSGRDEEAVSLLERAVALLPEDPDMRVNLGALLARQGKHSAAATQFQAALLRRPDHPVALLHLGVGALRRGLTGQAARFFEQASALGATDDAHNNLGALLACSGRKTEARRHFFLAMRTPRLKPIARANLGLLSMRAGPLLRDFRLSSPLVFVSGERRSRAGSLAAVPHPGP